MTEASTGMTTQTAIRIQMNVVTRFAPSPTGMLHIGGARTALFNYLFARHHGGDFKLRIEDTDTKRSTEEAKIAILEGLEWLGLRHEGKEHIVYQSQRADRHREVAEELVKKGQAYYCYTSAEELAEQRKAAEARGEAFRYNRAWRDSTATPPAGVKPSIRIKAPLNGEVVVKDAVQGDVTFGASELDDLIIMRSDGTPTYMHAVVVDDHDMGITHIIRGDDHLNNAGRQIVIYQAMGWEVPIFAHIPLIHGPDGAKLSKRHGATSVTEYADMGYLPEAMRNYLVRLGWSHGDDEIFSDAQAIEWFANLSDINKAPARLDFAKLAHVNAHYIKLADNDRLAKLMVPFLPALSGEQHATLLKALDSIKPRASTIRELADGAMFYLVAPNSYDEKATQTLAKGKENLGVLIAELERLQNWSEVAIKDAVQEAATTTGKKLGELMPPMRAAIVGAMSGPDIPVAMAILGKAESLKRLQAAA
jgi:glutamyl-tRNA synthetase